MLFDLQGKRRRVVQATYLGLAVVMGGGLVGFGVGSDVSGGLFDAFQGGGGSGSTGNQVIEDRIERFEARLKRDPRSAVTLKELVRDNYNLAQAQTTEGDQTFPDEAKDELRAADRYWQRYLTVEKEKPDASLASVALQVYDIPALNKAEPAKQAAQIIAETDNTPESYIRLVQYAALADDKRTADLAGQKAIDLAPKDQRKTIAAQVKQAKKAKEQLQALQQGQGGG